MKRALALGRRGSGSVYPNPMVGALIVNERRICGRGFHEIAGGRHAEVMALEEAGDLSKGATLYVTLEPCNHYGRTQPCTEAIINAGIKRVVIAVEDDNPEVCGGGIARLREAGIEVKLGLLADEVQEVNSVWHNWVSTKKCFVLCCLCLSLDGKSINSADNNCHACSFKYSNYFTRLERHFEAVMFKWNHRCSIERLLVDSNCLTLKVVIDPELSLCQNLSNRNYFVNLNKVLVCTTSKAAKGFYKELEKLGCNILLTENSKHQIDFSMIFDFLVSRGVQGLMCEGDNDLSLGLLKAGLCNRLFVYRMSKVVENSRELFSPNSEELEQFKLLSARCFGSDILSFYGRS